MNTRIFDAFRAREEQVTEYMAGCGMRYGMDCSCGPGCRCTNCPIHVGQPQLKATTSTSSSSLGLPSPLDFGEVPIQVDQPMAFSGFEMQPPPAANHQAPLSSSNQGTQQPFSSYYQDHQQYQQPPYRPQRNPSAMYGNRGSLRGMSVTSEMTFGRAMSGLSALSIDWENLDDFDVDVDHSENVNGPNAGNGPNNGGGGGARRTSATRRSILSTGSQDSTSPHVSFKVQ
jgi:hypothetical protein